MKKVVLILTLVFAARPLMNASNSNENTNSKTLPGCWEVADMVDNISAAYAECNGHSYSYEQSFNVWAAAYDACMFKLY